MANPGAKYVSVNVNKSYGRQHYPSHQSHFQHFNGGGGGSYGQAAAADDGKGRTGSAGGRGMVVLSRNRGAAPKVVPKLSVPPPLNLPSLRKEHEKFDISGPGGGLGGGAGTGTGGRPSSSGMGWTKPILSTTALPERNNSRVDAHGIAGIDTTDGVARRSGSYMPPSARSNGVGVVSSISINRDFAPAAGKAMILRGEDFPSLQDARPSSSSASQKQKDGLNQQKHVASEELVQDKRDSYHLGPTIDAHQPSRNMVGNGSVEKDEEGNGMGNLRRGDHIQKQKAYFPDPLPLVSLNPRSDWADDERDTGLGFMERGRDAEYSKSENYWDKDFDFSKPSVLLHKAPQIQYDKRSQRDNEAGKNYSSEVPKMDPYSTDLRGPSREGGDVNKWRASPFSRDGSSSQDGGNDRFISGSTMPAHSNMVKMDNKYVPPYHGDSGRDGNNTFYRDSTYGKRDFDLVGRQKRWNNSTELYNEQGTERNYRDRHVMELPNRYIGDNFQNSASSRSYLAASVKLPPIADPMLTMGRDKRFFRGEKPFSEDPYSRDIGYPGFDETDLLSGGLVGVIKRKKDAAKSTEFHDPVRESFEAELERVQKMQELERQRIIEEQERALEQAHLEEEERQRRIREEEERQRRVEEEAREAAWRAEQEQLESIRKAEELKIAKEEENRRIHLEDERRKEAAKQMLLELEAKMAKRQAESAKDDVFVSNTVMDEKLEAAMQEQEISRNLELDIWEDGERMVEKATTSAPFNSFAPRSPIEMGLRPYPPREGSSVFIDSGKAINSWRKDVFENGGGFPSPPLNQEVGRYSPKQDAIGGGTAVPRKEFRAGAASMSSRSYSKEGVQDFYIDEFGYQKDHRWNLPGDADSHSKFRKMDSEFPDSGADRHGDYAWSHGHSRVSRRPPYPERLYPNPDSTELYSNGRSRYSVRQPHVLPPPIASAQRTNVRCFTERSGPSPFLNNESPYMHTARSESAGTAYYGSNQGGLEPSDGVAVQQENRALEDQKFNNTSRCDSPSSLSVSSPPTSPPHLSHDELDESGDFCVTSAAEDGNRSLLTESESTILNENSGNSMLVPSADSISAVEEDEEWTLENNETLQLQEEYDEDEDGYREEDEVHEGDDENLELNSKFVELELEKRDSSHVMDNVVLGFDEGVEVVIPSDKCEQKLGPQEGSFGIPNSSISMLEERGDAGVPSIEQTFLSADDSSRTTADSSFGKFTDITSVLHGSIRQPVGAPLSSATSGLSLGADSLGNTGLPAQQTVSSSGDVTAAAGVISLPSLLSASPQLQFGLFSGPSLIPTPVPSIQIGSIQMPLHIHPPIGPSLTHVHPSQPSMFQLGQLHYSSPISQGILSLDPQSVSFVKPNMQDHVNLDQNAGGFVPHQPAQDISARDVTKDGLPSREINKQHKSVSAPLGQPNRSLSSGHNSADPSSLSGVFGASDKKSESESGLQADVKELYGADSRSYLPSSKERCSRQLHHVHPTVQSIAGETNFSRHRDAGTSPGNRGRRFAYSVKNSHARSYSQADDMPADSNGYQRRPRRTIQRTEFRVRENSDRRQAPLFGSSKNMGLDDNSNFMGKSVGVFTRHGSKRGTISNRTMKQRTDSEPSVSGNIVSQDINYAERTAKKTEKGSSVKSQSTSHPGEANLSSNVSEDDFDAPLQSGIVRIFKQSGIEAPSDEDDFIEVRSKRQMLNDRRERREKEIKAKSSTTKPPRKQHFTRQNVVASRSYNKVAIPSRSEESRNSNQELTASGRPLLARNYVPTGFTGSISQPLVPIGTLVVNSEMLPINPPLAGLSDAPNCSTDPEAMLVSINKAKDHVQSSLTTSTTHGINQQVMSLTQTQLDEAMKPAQCDSHLSTVGGHLSTVSDPTMTTSPIIAKDKSIPSAASSINSLLAGERIQFGAVTSPTVLPLSSRVSHGIGAPGSNRSDVQMSRNFAVAGNDSSLFFGKKKHMNDFCAPLQDCEAATEAVSSAAAISRDEIVCSVLGSANIPDTKSVGGADIDGITKGVVGDQHSPSQSQGEEFLSVSLPADLSIETTPISLWPPLPSPQSSSGQMLSHFAGGPPSHFPLYEMNQALGGPIYTFSQHEESPIAQSQPQISVSSTSGPLGNWQHHSGVDSYYGLPSGFPGPFVSPPGGIPGVQGPPHMVVYNHYAPVGQYGQVGLSFLGTTYIPSGKQADWKHTPTSSALHTGEGDINSTGMTTVHRNAPNMTSPIQHLSPGSPLLPMGSPLPMFDVSPFQTASDMSIQARWAHIPASPLHSVPISQPMHPQVEGELAPQANHGHALDQQLPFNRFPESRVPTSADNVPNYTPTGVASAAPFSAEFVLADSLRSSAASSGQSILAQNSSGIASIEAGKTGTLDNDLNNNGKNQKAPFPQKNGSAHPGNYGGYRYQRGGGDVNRNNAGNEWSHRRTGFHGKSQSGGMDKGFTASKMKQVYVVKQTTKASSTN